MEDLLQVASVNQVLKIDEEAELLFVIICIHVYLLVALISDK